MTILNSNLSNATIAALAKLVSDSVSKKAIAGLEPGDHEINEILHLNGVFKVGEPYVQEIPAKARPLLLVHRLAKVIDKLCLKLNSLAKPGDELYDAEEILTMVIKSHIEEPSKSQEEHIKKRIKNVIESMGATTETNCNGKTRFEGFVNPVDPKDIDDLSANELPADNRKVG